MSLEEYVGRMAGRAGEDLLHHRRQLRRRQEQPALELFRAKGIEVLLLSDRIDEWMMSYLTELTQQAVPVG
ncbi:hypothetical protein M8494_20385 [Serratia ureilytica]